LISAGFPNNRILRFTEEIQEIHREMLKMQKFLVAARHACRYMNIPLPIDLLWLFLCALCPSVALCVQTGNRQKAVGKRERPLRG
jgi:hypothetical protein